MIRSHMYWFRFFSPAWLTFSVGWCCALTAYTSAEAPDWSSMLGSAPAASRADATWAPARSMQAYIRAVRPARSCAFGSAWSVQRRKSDGGRQLQAVCAPWSLNSGRARVSVSFEVFVFWLSSENLFYETVTLMHSCLHVINDYLASE